jgi:hypothetical protein
MEIRKYTNFQAFNALGMQDFGLARIEEGPDSTPNLVVQASDGYWEHFGAEITFINVGYIACACFFLFVDLRQASLQECPVAGEYPGYNIYCFEETNQPPRRYYIVARDIEITVHYAGENIETVFGLSDRIERGEHSETEMPTFSRSTAQEKPLKPRGSRLFPWIGKKKKKEKE